MATKAEDVELPDPLDLPELEAAAAFMRLVASLGPQVPATLLVKPEDAAKYLGVGRQAMYLMLTSGEIPSIRKNRKILVPVKALTDWVDEQIEIEKVKHASA
jgi:excisionase family DNA binding protein